MVDSSSSDMVEKKRSGDGLMGKIVIASIIGAVILVETAVAVLLIPNPPEVAAKVREGLKAEYANSVEDADLLGDDAEGPVVEVELGEFNITIHDMKSQSTYTIDCAVMATVGENDESEFMELLELNKSRLREKIMIEFRNAKVGDLSDSELGLIKRRILEKSNALFGKPLIRAVLLPDFNYYQQ